MALTAFWKLNETSGTSCADSTGNGYTGTAASSPTIVDGKSGKCRDFTPSASRVNINYNGLFATSTPSVFMWIKPSSTSISPAGGGHSRMLMVASSGSYQVLYIRFSNYAGPTYLNFINGTGSGFSDGGADNKGIPVSEFTAGKWYYIGFTQSGTTIKQYLNGRLYNQYTSSGNFATFNGTPNSAISWSTAGEEFAGPIDEVEIHNTAISDAQVKNKYAFYQGFI